MTFCACLEHFVSGFSGVCILCYRPAVAWNWVRGLGQTGTKQCRWGWRLPLCHEGRWTERPTVWMEAALHVWTRTVNSF